MGVLRQKHMAQMKEQIKAPENIRLSNKEIGNLTDAEFKTLIIRMHAAMVDNVAKQRKK